MRIIQLVQVLGLVVLCGVPATAAQLRIALNAEPDVLDPDLSQTITGRDVLSAMCDSLFDLTENLQIQPRLAVGWKWSLDRLSLEIDLRQDVTFHDGTAFDAAAAKANLERSINLPDSFRAKDLETVEKIQVSGPHKLKIFLREYDNSLIYKLSDTTGMMISPKAAHMRTTAGDSTGETGDGEFSRYPVCAGPFRFVSAPKDLHRVTLEKNPDYWNAAAIHFDSLVFQTITDARDRFSLMENGMIDIFQEPRTKDIIRIRLSDTLQLLTMPSFSFQFFFINLSKGEDSKNPMGQNALVRRAFNSIIDRNRINETLFAGLFEPGNQPFPPQSPWYYSSNSLPVPDVDAARFMIQAAGYDQVSVNVLVEDNSEKRRLFALLQEMAAEIGLDLVPQFVSFSEMLEHLDAGSFQMALINWVGRLYPEYNVNLLISCDAPFNYSYYCNPEVDQHLILAQKQNNPSVRLAYHDAAGEILAEDMPMIYLYHPSWVWVMPSILKGFTVRFDGAMRFEGMRFTKYRH